MAIVIVYQYSSPNFKYSIRESQYKGKTMYFINVLICCREVYYHLAEKNNDFGALKERYAKNKIMKCLREKCVGTTAEEQMKTLPIFIEEGYQESLFPEQ